MAGFVTVADIKKLDDGQHADRANKGLYLQIRTSERTGETTGSWLFRYKPRGIGAKSSRMLGLGQFDTANAQVSLETARRKAADMRDLIAKGVDPAEQRTVEQQQTAQKVEASERPTFLQFATEYVKRVESGWRNPIHRQQWYNTLGLPGAGKRRMRYCDPIHHTKIDKIDIAAVKRVLGPIWATRVETAARLRGRLEAILEAARVEGLHPGPNPATGATVKALGYQPKVKLREIKHHA